MLEKLEKISEFVMNLYLIIAPIIIIILVIICIIEVI